MCRPEAAWPSVLEKVKSLKAACPMWCSNREKELSLPGASTSQRCETPHGHKFQLLSVHSGPHDLWGHRAYIRPSLPFFDLFFLQSLRRRRLPSRASPAHIFSSHPTLHGGELQLPAHLTKETSSQHKLYHPLSCDWTPAGEPQPATELHNSTETNKTVSHNFERHNNFLFPFPRTVKHLGLMIY